MLGEVVSKMVPINTSTAKMVSNYTTTASSNQPTVEALRVVLPSSARCPPVNVFIVFVNTEMAKEVNKDCLVVFVNSAI